MRLVMQNPRPTPRKLTPLVRERLAQQLDAALRENAELVKDKHTLSCALEYAKKDCAYWVRKHDALLMQFGQKLAKKRKAKR